MPRPSKHVSPDTLGGRIRAAREDQRLSLAEVADGHYSTSLISQIERNRVDPSRDSLRFLAERLKLSVDDLEILAHQHRESEVEAREYTSYDTLRSETAHLFNSGQVDEALANLHKLHFSEVPPLQRWRLAALRGLCYFEKRQFVKAQGDLVYATHEEPNHENLPTEQKQERMLLHLRLAATFRELGDLEEALEEFEIALGMMNRETPFGYVAEAYWGMSLIAYAQALKFEEGSPDRTKLLHIALEHSEHAKVLCRSIGETLHAASITYNIAEIEYTLGNIEKASDTLSELLKAWNIASNQSEKKPQQQEHANIVSSASCLLAEIELDEGKFEQALSRAELALIAGRSSYILRRADAYVTLGRIYGEMNNIEKAKESFQEAIKELENTDRIGVRINIHVQYSSYLIKIGQIEEGQRELEKIEQLSGAVSSASNETSLSDFTR